MDDLKIKIDNNLDELVDLFGQLGCRYFNHTCTARNYLLYEDGVVFFCKLKKNFNESKAKEVTINQLKDMVVLKRNDLSDANAYCHDNDEQYYITSSGEYFFYLVGDSVSKWIESSNDISYLRKYVKPIQNSDLPFIDSEESLNDKVASAEAARQEMKADNVNNPSHYNKGGIECIEAIKASMTHEAFCGYLKGNVQKYMWRYEVKGGVESLQKAQWYLNKLIEVKIDNS